METLILMKYFENKNKGISTDDETILEELKKDFDNKDNEIFHEDFNETVTDGMCKDDYDHFSEAYAKYIVSDMYHIEDSKTITGERFSMDKAKEIYEKYKKDLNPSATYSDIYVAVNFQYHSYCKLFKEWFGNYAEQRIIESAILFWFKNIPTKNMPDLWKCVNSTKDRK